MTGAEPGEALTLYGQGGRRLLTLTADDKGQAQFAYLPKRYGPPARAPTSTTRRSVT